MVVGAGQGRGEAELRLSCTKLARAVCSAVICLYAWGTTLALHCKLLSWNSSRKVSRLLDLLRQPCACSLGSGKLGILGAVAEQQAASDPACVRSVRQPAHRPLRQLEKGDKRTERDVHHPPQPERCSDRHACRVEEAKDLERRRRDTGGDARGEVAVCRSTCVTRRDQRRTAVREAYRLKPREVVETHRSCARCVAVAAVSPRSSTRARERGE